MKKIYIPQGGGRDFWLRIPMNNESAGRHLCMDDVDENEMHVWLESGYGGCWTLVWEKDGAQRDGIAAKVPASQLGYGTYSVVMAGKFVNGDDFRTKRQLFIRLVDREDQADAEPTMYNEEQAYWAGPAVLSEMLSRDGLNTYELAVIHGFEGTLEEYLEISGLELQDLMVTKAKLSREVQTQLDRGSEKAITPKGDYDEETEYRVNDLVYDSETMSSYVSLSSANIGNPVTDEEYWMKVLDGDHINDIERDAEALLANATDAANNAAAAANLATSAAEHVVAQKVAQAQVGYYTCNTVAGTATKATTSNLAGTDQYSPASGGAVKIKIAEANTSTDTVYLQFGSDTNTKKPLYYNGLAVDDSNSWENNEVISVYFDPSANNNAGAYFASNAQGGGGKAEKIKYDNSQSGFAATDVQNALDEVDDNFHLGSGVNERINLSEYTTLQTYPNVGGGNKWLTNNNTYRYTGKFIPITAGQQYKIVAQESSYCQYALLKEEAYTNHDQGTPVQYATGTTRTDVSAGTSVIITAPEDAAYLYVAVYVGSDITPSAVFEYPNISIKEYIQDMDEEPTEGSSNLVSSGGVYEMIQDLNDDIESINSAVLDATYAVDSTTTLNLTCNHSSNPATYKQYYKFTIGKKYRITLSVESAASEIIQLVDLPRTGFTPWIGVMNLPTGALTKTYIYTPSSVNGYLQAYTETNTSNEKAVTAVIEQLSTLQDVNDGLLSFKAESSTNISTNSADIDKIEDQVYYESGMTYKSYTGNRITPNRIGFKAIGSIVTGQSAAVFGDIAFALGANARTANVFNMKTRTVIKTSIPVNGAPSKTDWHCNSSEFGTNYYAEGDEFPLLYIGGNQGDAAHELLVCRVVPNTTKVYQLNVVQVLTMPNDWGYANVAFDEERGKLILCAAEMIFRVCNPPAVVDGGGNPISTYTFTEEDVEQTITIDASSFPVAQDVAMHRGLLYLGNGHGAQDNAFFRVIDLYNGTLINDISIVGWFTDSAEGYSFYNEHMYIFGSSNVYKFWFM